MINRLNILTGILIIHIVSCSEKEKYTYFTGTIIYKYHFTSDSLNVDSLSGIRPDRGMMHYALDGYESSFSRSDSVGSSSESAYYYYGPTNRCLSLEKDTQYCEDYGIQGDSVLSVKVHNTEEKILGYACKIVELQKKTSLVKYHVSTELISHPLTYERHRAFNWDVYGKNAGGGIVLKVEHVFKHFTMYGMADKVMIDKSAADLGLKAMTEKCQLLQVR